ncbi:hypothetical protein TNCV_4964401 [Trichonephila clavipes]|nr:hypothetical protein TNCV_4964401 [Trichonephila clavipes]
MTNRSCNFSPFMNSTPSITNAASVVAQSKKDHVPGLGTGPEAVNNGIKSIHLTDSVDLNWCSLKEMILKAAKKYIPRGKLKNSKPYLSSKSPLLQSLLKERTRIFENRDTGRSNHVLTQEHLMENCGNFSETLAMSNRKQNKCNTILSEDGNLSVNDEQAADLLRLH